MAEEKKGTIYQQLNKMLNLDGFGFEDQQSSIATQKKEKIIIKGSSPEEIHRKGLELEQKKALQNKFFRTTDRGFQKALQYEAARLPAYIDYEGMEFYPIISSALDLFMEECTTIGVDGKMLNIYSNKERIKFLLEEFFYDIVNVNVNLPFWTRNLPIKWDSVIPLLDGTEITIKELSNTLRTNPNKEIWTYSIQDNTNNIVPSKVIWCDLTRTNTQIIRINLDDNTYVETTPDHEFLLRSGKHVKASDLKSGDSLMPFYTIDSKEGNHLSGYEKVYNPATNHYKFTHRLVSMELLRDIISESKYDDKIVTHHKDFNKKNNHPSNLIRMTNTSHSELHSKHASKILKRPDVIKKRIEGIDKYLRSDKRRNYLSNVMKGKYPSEFEKYNSSEQHLEHNKIRSKSMLRYWSDNNYKSKVKESMYINLNDELLSIINTHLINSITYISKTQLCDRLVNDQNFIRIFKSINRIKRDLNKSLNAHTLNSMILRKTGLNYMSYYSHINLNIKLDNQFIRIEKIKNTKISNYTLNHKVTSIEYINNLEDVYCMEVVGANGEHDRHNFPICSKNERGEYTRNGIFVSNCKYGDNFVLTYGERKKGITHVKQLVNYEIERFERIQNGMPTIKFKERMTGDEFNVFEVAHFRLLGDDKYLPYGSCLLSDTYIKTSNGIKEIKDIVRGDVVCGFDVETQKLITSNVLDVVCNGEKNIFKISTAHNFIKATDNHKILIYDYLNDEFKYKFVSDLKIGDGLIINKSDDYHETIKINKLVEIKEHNNRIYDDFVGDLKHIPDYINEDFAKMFGFLLGDGGVNSKRPYMVYFTYGVHETINKKYIELLQKFSGKEIYLRKNKSYGNGIASAMVNSKSLATVLINMEFIGNARNKRIPKWVYSTSKDIRKAFLEGIMDADGSVNIDKWNYKRFQIQLSNYSLINDIKLLAQSLGYKTGDIKNRKPRIGGVIINGNEVINVADSYNLYFYESENIQTKSSNIKNRKTDDFIVEKIKSIESDGKGFVYDIHVDDENHNFFANGIVVHNSILNKIRRVFRQLVMAEDAMLTYRIVRAGEKKVFKIDVGNIDEDDVEDYIYKIATKFKKLTSVAGNDGQIDYRFNVLGNDEDYFLPVRNANVQTGIDTLPGACLSLETEIELIDGRTLKLNQIIDEFNSGKKLSSYSVNPNNGNIVPGIITWAGITRKDTQVLKLTLDNGESVIITPDHKFPTIYNGIKEAKDLMVGEHLWAFNKLLNIKYNVNMVYDHYLNEWIYVNQLVDDYYDSINIYHSDIITSYNDEINTTLQYCRKITTIEWLTDKQDTGTITIDGNEICHNFHNFALGCGIFTQNSNLNQIQDIEYLRDNLFIGLGVPKPFLSFQDAAGGGKNLAQYDIRFTKKINRIQQALIQELNKMAMIHLYLLGYTGEDLSDFMLTLTNPSVQQELLKSELMREKAQTYTELTRGDNGIAAMSHTNAKKLIFNWSEREIVHDMKQQKMEKVIMQELADSPVTIKKSGLFADIDKKYGIPEEEIANNQPPNEEGDGSPENEMGAPEGAGEGSAMGGGGVTIPEPPSMGQTPPPPMAESNLTNDEYDELLEKIVMGDLNVSTPTQKKTLKRKEIINESNLTNDKLNRTAQNMINEIDKLLEMGESLNTNNANQNNDNDINIDNIELD